ncbi:MAG: metallophosphoesterase [Eubacteriales bacterium]
MNIRRLKITDVRDRTLNGLKIAVTADLHSRDGHAALERLAACEPDVICAPGDILQATDRASVRECFNRNGFTFLAECRKIAPVLYSLGNHERGMTEENRTILADAGITLLDNTWISYGSLYVGGLSSGYVSGKAKQRKTPTPDLPFLREFAMQPGFRILLCHHPEYWPAYIRETGIELTLSGHAHGGQWQFPLTDRGVYAPGQGLFPKYTSGVYGNRLAVSRGMANTVCVPRFFNPREILLLELNVAAE